MADRYFTTEDRKFTSYISTAGPESNEADEIHRFRGSLYKPHDNRNEWDFIADTDITLVGEDKILPAKDYRELREFHQVFDRQKVPGHKLDRTSYFFVRNNDMNGDIAVSGWLVPYSPLTRIPMENLGREQGYKWDGYLEGKNDYLIENSIGPIDTMNAVEIGRLCSLREKASPIAVLLAFKTLHKFLEELGVDNYFDAAMDINGRGLASLYETVGMRKVEQYTCDTVTDSKIEDGTVKPVLTPITYWSQHMNIPHTQERIRSGDFGSEPIIRNGAKLIERRAKFIAPYIFGKNSEWELYNDNIPFGKSAPETTSQQA